MLNVTGNFEHSNCGSSFVLSCCVDDFGDIVTLYTWTAIVARMDYILSEGE